MSASQTLHTSKRNFFPEAEIFILITKGDSYLAVLFAITVFFVSFHIFNEQMHVTNQLHIHGIEIHVEVGKFGNCAEVLLHMCLLHNGVRHRFPALVLEYPPLSPIGTPTLTQERFFGSRENAKMYRTGGYTRT